MSVIQSLAAVLRRKSNSTPALGTYYDEVMADSPVAYWRLGESSGATAADETTNHDATLTNTGSITYGLAGAVGGNTSMDMTGAFGTRSAAVLTGALPFTVECWVKTSSAAGQNMLIAGKSDFSKSAGVSIGSGLVSVYSNGNGGTYYSAASAGTYDDGAWHHVVGVVQATGLELFVDGASVATLTQAITAASDFDMVSLASWLNGADGVSGQLDECAVYASALSAGRIAAHYAAA